MEKYYKIAGLAVKMDTFGRTENQAEPYRTESCPHADIIIPDFAPMRKQPGERPDEDGLEYQLTGRAFNRNLIRFDGLMLHASAIAVDGKAYLFSADSGTGKSTHTRLWQQVLGAERVTILNDDKPALRRIQGKWYVFGTPWSGKTGENRNLQIPLAGICFLERSKVNAISPYTKNDIVFQFLKQTYRYRDADWETALLTLLDSLIKTVPVWHLRCNMEPEAARMAYQAMAEEGSDI